MQKKYLSIIILFSVIFFDLKAWGDIREGMPPIIGEHRNICPTVDQLKKILNDKMAETTNPDADITTLFMKDDTLQNINRVNWKVNNYALMNTNRITDDMTCLSELLNVEQNRAESKSFRCVYTLSFPGSKLIGTKILFRPTCRISLELETE